jgi:hypothetical protein
VEATGENVPSPIASFDDANLPAALAANTKRCNYSKPTPVQKYSIPIGLAHRDLMACAQTGSGKTAAFCFPVRGPSSCIFLVTQGARCMQILQVLCFTGACACDVNKLRDPKG